MTKIDIFYSFVNFFLLKEKKFLKSKHLFTKKQGLQDIQNTYI